MRTSLVSVVVVLLSFILPGGASAKSTAQMQRVRVVHDIVWNRQSAWHWQDRAAVPRTRSEFSERHVRGIGYLLWERGLWSRRRVMALRFARAHPYRALVQRHYAFWMCVHGGEGAWDANTGNSYYGGLQMSYGWGGVARPDLLSPAEQIALAERQFAETGYSTSWLRGQWPNTSPPCLNLL